MITLNEEILFFSAIYDTKIDINNTHLIQQIRNLPADQQSRPRVEDSGYQTPNLFDTENLKELFVKIQPVIDTVSNRWGIKRKLKLVNYWAHINKKYDYGMSHIHPEGIISGIYYAKVPTNSGNIVFERTDNQEYFFEGDDLNSYNYKNFFHAPYEGMLILFPSWVRHKVQQNITNDVDDERISIAFNYR